MRPFLLLLSLVAAAPAAAAGQAPAPPPDARADTSASYYFLLGRHLESEGRIDEAIAAHRKAADLSPELAEPHAELAGLYARQNRAVDAVEAAEAALKRDPKNKEANRIIGSVYAALSEQRKPLRPGENISLYPTRAIAALEEARGDGAFDVTVELALGRLYTQRGEHAKAIGPLHKVVEDQPGYPEAAMLLAGAYDEAGRPDDAIRTLEMTVRDNPTFARGRVRLAEMYEGRQRFKEAAALYREAQAMNPRADLTGPHATALINAGEAAAARDIIETALKRRAAPDAGLLYLLAQAQRRAGDAAAAAATAARLKQAFPDDLRGVYLDAQLADAAGRRDEAIAAFKVLTERAPEDPTFVYQYAHLLEQAGRVPEAEAALRALLARDPLDANALNSLGYMFAERGERLDEAVELLQRALKVEPGNPSFLDSLGWAYFRQGRLELADDPLTKAAADLPASSVVQDHLAQLRVKQQRYPDAVSAWERSLAGDGEGIDRAIIEKKLQDARGRIKR